MERNQLALLFSRSAAASTQKVLERCGAMPASLTKAQAYRLYGRTNVDRWIFEGLITPGNIPGGFSKNLIDKAALDRVAAQSNRITYLAVADR